MLPDVLLTIETELEKAIALVVQFPEIVLEIIVKQRDANVAAAIQVLVPADARQFFSDIGERLFAFGSYRNHAFSRADFLASRRVRGAGRDGDPTSRFAQ